MLAPRADGRSSHRQPRTNSSSRIGPTWPSFSEYRTGQSSPASSRIPQRIVADTGMSAIAPTTQAISSPVQTHTPAGPSSANGTKATANGGG